LACYYGDCSVKRQVRTGDDDLQQQVEGINIKIENLENTIAMLKSELQLAKTK